MHCDFSRAKGVGLDFRFIKATVGDCQHSILAERVVGRAEAGGPERDCGMVQIAGVVKTGVAHEFRIFAVCFWARRSETQNRCERRILQLSERGSVYIADDGSICGELAQDARRRPGVICYTRQRRKRPALPVIMDTKHDRCEQKQYCDDNPGAFCRGDWHVKIMSVSSDLV